MRIVRNLTLGVFLSMNILVAQVKVGEGKPDFTIVHDDGTRLTFGPYLNKVLLINFFATWCGPCQQEMAEVEESIWSEYKDYPDFALLMIGVGHTDAELKEYNEKKGFSFPLYPDEVGEIFNKFALGEAIPRIYLVDKSNHVVFESEGYSPTGIKDLREAVRKVLQSQPFEDDPLQNDEME